MSDPLPNLHESTQHTDTSRCDSSRDALFVGRSSTLQAGRWAVSVSC